MTACPCQGGILGNWSTKRDGVNEHTEETERRHCRRGNSPYSTLHQGDHEIFNTTLTLPSEFMNPSTSRNSNLRQHLSSNNQHPSSKSKPPKSTHPTSPAQISNPNPKSPTQPITTTNRRQARQGTLSPAKTTHSPTQPQCTAAASGAPDTPARQISAARQTPRQRPTAQTDQAPFPMNGKHRHKATRPRGIPPVTQQFHSTREPRRSKNSTHLTQAALQSQSSPCPSGVSTCTCRLTSAQSPEPAGRRRRIGDRPWQFIL
ncbi:hypothetical protein QBC39DRAFT_48520 [Podospora conica]|nr:hypothetical protein QBC39DRAFT_48520 [Schizothecium conicum]